MNWVIDIEPEEEKDTRTWSLSSMLTFMAGSFALGMIVGVMLWK